MKTSSAHRWLDIVLTALAPMIWGSTYIVSTELLPPDRPFTAALLRTLPAGLLLVVLCRNALPCGQWRVDQAGDGEQHHAAQQQLPAGHGQ